MADFKVIDKFQGFRADKDITKQEVNVLIEGSENVLVVDNQYVENRNGYTLDGASSEDQYPIYWADTWNTNTAREIPFRSFNGKIQFRYSGTWYDLASITNDVTAFTTWWSSTEVLDLALFVNGTANTYMWGGGVTTFASATANTITKEGTTSWAEERFFTNSNKTIIIDSVEYTYTGGEGTTTLTGVSPDPTSAGHAVGSLIKQKIVTHSNIPSSSFKADLIYNFNNNVYYGATDKRSIFISANTSYTTFTPSSPRLPGEGATLTLDQTPTMINDQEDAVYISGAKDDFYQVVFTLSSDLSNEKVTIKKLKSGKLQGARSQKLSAKVKESLIFITHENRLETLGRIENITTPRSKPISESIKNVFENYDFTNGQLFHLRGSTYITLPVEGLVLIFDHENNYWQPPQKLSLGSLSVIDGNLYGHSSYVSETYKLFDPTVKTDNGNTIKSKAVFAYNSYNERIKLKEFNEFFVEGLISLSTVIKTTLKYGYKGFISILEKDINGNDSGLMEYVVSNTSIGEAPIGEEPIGEAITATEELQKFRIIHEVPFQDFYEYSVEFETDSDMANWRILAFGANTKISKNDNSPIKR